MATDLNPNSQKKDIYVCSAVKTFTHQYHNLPRLEGHFVAIFSYRFIARGCFTLKMEAIYSSETSVHTRTTRLHNPENGILHSHRRENLRSDAIEFISLKSIFNIILSSRCRYSLFARHSQITDICQEIVASSDGEVQACAANFTLFTEISSFQRTRKVKYFNHVLPSERGCHLMNDTVSGICMGSAEIQR
jgi:hypothetical protein